MTHGEILERILKVMPYPDQMSNFSFEGDGGVRFTWRGDKFRVDNTLHVTQIEQEDFLTANNKAIILQQLIKGGHQ